MPLVSRKVKRAVARFVKIVVAIIVILVVAYMVKAGVIDPRRVRSQAVVQLDRVKTGAAGALSGGTSSGGNSVQCATTCRSNLERIERAKRALQSRGMFATGDTNWAAVTEELGGTKPKCPCGGSYSLGSLQQAPSCSIGGNGTPDQRDDHILASY